MADTKRTVKWGDLSTNSGSLSKALAKIYEATFESYDIINKIVTLQEEIEPHQKSFAERHKKLVEAILPKDEEGKVYTEIGSPEHTKFNEEYQKLYDTEIEIKSKKILVAKNEVKEAELKLNANDIRSLRGVFEIRKSK